MSPPASPAVTDRTWNQAKIYGDTEKYLEIWRVWHLAADGGPGDALRILGAEAAPDPELVGGVEGEQPRPPGLHSAEPAANNNY